MGHRGRQNDSSLSRLPTFSASAVTCPITREVPKEMEPEDIADVVSRFGRAASNARAAGADGVEIHGATGYLVQQFMSPLTNRRTDAYGGSLEKRLRFPLEVIGEIREKAGPDLAVGIRIVADEFLDGGLTLDVATEMAARLEASGKLDYISVNTGMYASIRVSFPLGMGAPLGVFVSLASQIKSAVSIPVVVSGRMIDPTQAEQVLADGHADIIGMCRALICDPELPKKALAGDLDDIRTCVACNQGCFGRSAVGKPITCLLNPAVGYEKEMGVQTLKPVPIRKRVLVAGGGPAGMEAARVAALRGHEVHLYEKAHELGGRVNLAASVPSREEFKGVTRYLGRQMDRLKVHVHLGAEVTPDLVAQVVPDAVVVATGSDLVTIGVPGGDQDNVVSTVDVLSGTKTVGQKVLMVDDEGHHHGLSVALLLAEQGKDLEVVTRLPMVGFEVAAVGEMGPACYKLLSLSVAITPFTAVKEIEGRCVSLAHALSGAVTERQDVDTVVVVAENRANNGLYRSLKGKVKELYAVGDCVTPRRAMDAIYDANRIARLI